MKERASAAQVGCLHLTLRSERSSRGPFTNLFETASSTEFPRPYVRNREHIPTTTACPGARRTTRFPDRPFVPAPRTCATMTSGPFVWQNYQHIKEKNDAQHSHGECPQRPDQPRTAARLLVPRQVARHGPCLLRWCRGLAAPLIQSRGLPRLQDHPLRPGPDGQGATPAP